MISAVALGSLWISGSAASAADEAFGAVAEAVDAEAPAAPQLLTPSQPMPPRGPTTLPPTAPTTPPKVGPAPPVAETPPAPANPNEIALANSSAASAGMDSSSGIYDLASVPDMIGDAPGMRYMLGRSNVALAAGDRGIKIAEDSRPLPTDRVFFDFNYFDRANTTADGTSIGLERYTLGFEKTFFNGHASVEVRGPIDTGLNRRQSDQNSTSANEGTVFGDLTITPKVLLVQTREFALAVGVTIGLPTTPDEQYTTVGSPTIDVRIHSEDVHLAPFVGLQIAHDEHFFAIGYLQVDFDANGDRVSEEILQVDPVIGRLRSPTLLYGDLSMGYWLYRDRTGCDCGVNHYITGLAPIVELHYTTALQDAHSVGLITPLRNRMDALDMTAGVNLQLGACSSLTLADAFPLRTRGGDKLFDGELIVQFNRRF